MATYGEIVTRVADETTRPELGPQIKLAIQDAIRFYERRRFWFTDTRMTLVLDAGVSFYPLTLDRVDTVHMQDGRGGWALRLSDNNWMERMQDGLYRGEPTDWNFQGVNLRLSPTPDRAYTLVINGHRPTPLLVNDADSNVWTEKAEDLIVARAKRKLYSDVIREDGTDATVAAANEREALQSLMAQGARHGTTGQIRAYDL